jgi:hypothetical protein
MHAAGRDHCRAIAQDRQASITAGQQGRGNAACQGGS